MKKYGLIGKSLSHSFSKSFFSSFFIENKINASYNEFEIADIDDVKALLASPINGLNVTIPYKESIIPFLDELSLEAKEIGAVNTIKIINGKTKGYNTDAFGFHQSIKPFLTNHHEKAIVLGTGGASKAVAYILNNLGIDVFFISRTPNEMLNHFSYDNLNKEMISACKLIINTTPVGMYPDIHSLIPIDYGFLTEHHLCIDLIYNPKETLFLKNAIKNNASVLNGNHMLIEQAKESWKIWSK